VAHASEVVEAFGGAGYIEDTGIPRLLRDAQVLPIWEGTTNVLSLDLARAERTGQAVGALLEDLEALLGRPGGWPEAAGRSSGLDRAGELVGRSLEVLAKELRALGEADEAAVEAHLRRFALRLGRTAAGALLVAHAAHRIARHGDQRAARVAARYAERWLGAPPAPLPNVERLAQTEALLATVIPP
jgi:hypothetical protein